jgi:8-oxo-dGTP diphosphatase
MGTLARIAQRPGRLAFCKGLGRTTRRSYRGYGIRPFRFSQVSGESVAESALVEVAAAVILRPDGQFLLAQRPAGKVYAGYWEFPGGKAEPGEPLSQTLTRELHEELGIEVTRAYPWIVQRYVYPHAHVQLHFFRVVGWNAEPRPREQQSLVWAKLEGVSVGPMLPANNSVLRALALPTRLGITCARREGVEVFLQRLSAALAGGLRMVMVREKEMSATHLRSFATEVAKRCHAAGAKVVVNGPLDVARACGADGLHLPARDLLAAAQRPNIPLCGASCHDETELAHAARLGLDYVVLGPVLPTPSHPQHRPMGWSQFAELIKDFPLPVYAIGGMNEQQLESAWQSGAHGMAMLRAAWVPT